MARVKVNPILEMIKGKVGDLVFKQYGDEVIISRKADMSGRESTPEQLAAQNTFKQATLYGRMVQADPVKKAIYAEVAKEKGQPIFSLYVADYFNLPSVDEIDISGYTGKAGDVLRILAHDDFDVTGVTVTITNNEGVAIENGAAVETPVDSGQWVYTATQNVAVGTNVRIMVAAQDMPGHKGEKTEEKAV